MKLKQHLIIKQYFIDYSLGKYSDDKQPTVADYLVKVLEQPEYENELEITTLNKQPDGDISVIFESEKVLTEPQIYTRNIPNNSLMYLKKHIEASTYKNIKEIPLEVNNELVVTTEGGVKLSLLVDREFKGKEADEQKEILLDIFKRHVRIDFSQPEVIAGITFDLDKDSSWKPESDQLSIVSAVLSGVIEVYNDDRRFELSDVHIGKLTLDEEDDTPATVTKPFFFSGSYGEEYPVEEAQIFETKEAFFKVTQEYKENESTEAPYSVALVKSELDDDSWLLAPLSGRQGSMNYLYITELPDGKHPSFGGRKLIGVMFGGTEARISNTLEFPNWLTSGESMFESATCFNLGENYGYWQNNPHAHWNNEEEWEKITKTDAMFRNASVKNSFELDLPNADPSVENILEGVTTTEDGLKVSLVDSPTGIYITAGYQV